MLISKISEFIEEQVAKDEFSGAVLIVRDDNSILEYISGLENIENQSPISIHTKFNIGSMDKMITSVAIAQLAKLGKLNFQDKIVKYLPNFPQDIAKKYLFIIY